MYVYIICIYNMYILIIIIVYINNIVLIIFSLPMAIMMDSCCRILSQLDPVTGFGGRYVSIVCSVLCNVVGIWQCYVCVCVSDPCCTLISF